MKFFAPVLQLLQRFGVDRAVAYSLLSRVWFAVAGVLSLFLLTRFLSPDEQGFYYTFTSILGLQIFFELGLSYVVLQFASYEKAHLEWTPQGTLAGDVKAKGRLASLLRIGLRWYALAALLVVMIILPVGFWFFATHQPAGAPIFWKLPWIWVVLVSATSLLISPILAVLQGCGLVAEVALIRFYQTVAGSLLFWVTLLLHWRLAAAPVAITVAFFWSLFWLALQKRAFVADLLTFQSESVTVNWREEVWPLQWKIAVSWLSGYFIFQLFNPVLLAFSGAAEAGRMGLSVAAMSALVSVASVWIETKLAPFGNLIALRQFKELDRLFFSSLWRSFSIVVAGGALFWVVAFVLYRVGHPLSQRLLAPFLWLSVAIGILVSSSTFLLGRSFGVNGMMLGYLLITIVVGLGGGTWIFQQKRRLWQDAPVAQNGA